MASFLSIDKFNKLSIKERVQINVPFSLKKKSQNSLIIENFTFEGQQSKSYSFKDFIQNDELMQNPNILDSVKTKNSQINLVDKFDEKDDPIFDLDDTIEKTLETKDLNSAISLKLQNKLSKNQITKNSKFKR